MQSGVWREFRAERRHGLFGEMRGCGRLEALEEAVGRVGEHSETVQGIPSALQGNRL